MNLLFRVLRKVAVYPQKKFYVYLIYGWFSFEACPVDQISRRPLTDPKNLGFNRSSGTASLLRTFKQVSNLLKTHEQSKELAAGLDALKTKLATFGTKQEDAETQRRKALVRLLRRADFLRRMLISEGIAEEVPEGSPREDEGERGENSSHRPEEEIGGKQKADTQDHWLRLHGR